jgi:arylsulfatase A-like enzyme
VGERSWRADESGGLLLKRRDLLKAGAALPAVATAGPLAGVAAKKHDHSGRDAHASGKKKKKHKGNSRSVAGMNVLLFLIDQQRPVMHFPKNWEKQNLLGLHRLKQHGLSFERAFCNSCMCSPSRATLMTGLFPAQHGVKYTLEEDMPTPPYPQVELPLDLPNLASQMSAAGYHVPFKGKWHLSKPVGATWEPIDVNQYGFQRWDSPDAGANQDLDQFGGGIANNDGRYINDNGAVEVGNEGALAYLNSVAAQQQPFFLTVSLVNPHDVLSYPTDYAVGGYDNSDLVGTINLPETVHEDLSSKPTAQQNFLTLSEFGLGPLPNDDAKRNYLNFYGNLMKETDNYLVQILNTLDAQGLFDNTLIIYTADHGEMGMTHGGMRQKNFNFYEETIRVPLVYSNPNLYGKAKKTDVIVSHVDFLTTIANLFNVPDSARGVTRGVDYSKCVLNPKSKGVQSYTVFTFDDFQSGQASGPYVPPPNHISSIREGRYKLARYYDVTGTVPEQLEMYDLKKDPDEKKNLAAPGFKRSKEQEKQFQRLVGALANVENTRLQPL